jgi:hypothetical protein
MCFKPGVYILNTSYEQHKTLDGHLLPFLCFFHLGKLGPMRAEKGDDEFEDVVVPGAPVIEAEQA